MHEADRRECPDPGAGCCEGHVSPILGVVDHCEGREEIPNAAPVRRAHPPTRHHSRGEHHIHSIRRRRSNYDPDGNQRINGQPHVCRPFFPAPLGSFYQFFASLRRQMKKATFEFFASAGVALQRLESARGDDHNDRGSGWVVTYDDLVIGRRDDLAATQKRHIEALGF